MRGRHSEGHSQEPHFLEGEREVQRGLVQTGKGKGRFREGLRLCLTEVAEPGLKLRRSQPGSEEHLRGSQWGARHSGLWHWASGTWSGAGSLPQRPLVSPKGLLTGQSRWGQTGQADGVKWLAGAWGHVCDTSAFLWADSPRMVGPHHGGQAAKLLHCSGSRAEPPTPVPRLQKQLPTPPRDRSSA